MTMQVTRCPAAGQQSPTCKAHPPVAHHADAATVATATHAHAPTHATSCTSVAAVPTIPIAPTPVIASTVIAAPVIPPATIPASISTGTTVATIAAVAVSVPPEPPPLWPPSAPGVTTNGFPGHCTLHVNCAPLNLMALPSTAVGCLVGCKGHKPGQGSKQKCKDMSVETKQHARQHVNSGIDIQLAPVHQQM
jgi:hypothetical protein